jgi:hypothetical protein
MRHPTHRERLPLQCLSAFSAYAEAWVRQTVKDLGLEQSVRPEGRPRNASRSATDATGLLRGFRPVIRFTGTGEPILSRFPSKSRLAKGLFQGLTGSHQYSIKSAAPCSLSRPIDVRHRESR